MTDLIPDLLVNEAPKLIQETPKLFNELLTNAPEKLSKAVTRGKKLVESATELSRDPSLLQSTIDDARREARNVFKSIPEGLSTPKYSILKKTDVYEIRAYSGYSVASTDLKLESEQSSFSPIVTAKGFNTLADYIFGNNNENSKAEVLSMTTPVIITSNTMEFVLPYDKTASNAPVPSSDSGISLKDIPTEYVATLEFTGIATDGEVTRQRALLEDALLADGIVYDNLSFKVLQYNPPQTLPWLRRNEVLLGISLPADLTPPPATDSEGEESVPDGGPDASTYSSAPEAGD